MFAEFDSFYRGESLKPPGLPEKFVPAPIQSRIPVSRVRRNAPTWDWRTRTTINRSQERAHQVRESDRCRELAGAGMLLVVRTNQPAHRHGARLLFDNYSLLVSGK